jgi:hypothetical protein
VECQNDCAYDFIGMLDAELSSEPSYYQDVLAKFQNNPSLGIAGVSLHENCSGKWIQLRVSTLLSVSGAVQMFRRQCYEDIGGYMPLQGGGIDAIAEATARMCGWRSESFPDIKVLYYRPIGAEKRYAIFSRFRKGISHHRNGNHPLFEAGKCLYRISEKPYLLGSFLVMAGYLWSWMQRNEYSVPVHVIKHLRSEQKNRLLSLIIRR